MKALEAPFFHGYMSSRLISLNDLFSLSPDAIDIEINQFEAIVGRNFKQQKKD